MTARRPLVLTFAVAVVLGLGVGTAGSASAHTELLFTEPANGARATASPGAVVLHFTDHVTFTGDALRVNDGKGTPVTAGAPSHPGGSEQLVRIPLRPLPDGGYLVSWRVVSTDSHPIAGAFAFTVGDGAPLAPSAVAAARNDGDAAVSAFSAVARGLGYLALTALFGGLIFIAVCWRRGANDRFTRRLIAAGWALAVLTTVATLLLEGADAAGRGPEAMLSPDLVAQTLGTTFGVAHVVRLALLGVLAGGYLLLRRSEPSLRRRVITPLAVTVLGLSVLVTYPLGGHTGTGAGAPLATTVDVLHLIAMSAWVGGLILLTTRLLRRSASPDDLATAVPRFSRLALASVVVLGVTGSYQAWREAGSLEALRSTTYGSLVIAKVALFVVLVALGALARRYTQRRWIRRRPSAPGPGLGFFRASVTYETLIAVGALAVSASLVAANPARAVDPGTFRSALTLPGGGSVGLTLEPARVGTAALHVVVRDDAGRHRSVPEVRVGLAPPGGAGGLLPVALTSAGQGTYTASAVTLPTAGDWRLTVSVRTSEFDESSASTAILVRPRSEP